MTSNNNTNYINEVLELIQKDIEEFGYQDIFNQFEKNVKLGNRIATFQSKKGTIKFEIILDENNENVIFLRNQDRNYGDIVILKNGEQSQAFLSCDKDGNAIIFRYKYGHEIIGKLFHINIDNTTKTEDEDIDNLNEVAWKAKYNYKHNKLPIPMVLYKKSFRINDKQAFIFMEKLNGKSFKEYLDYTNQNSSEEDKNKIYQDLKNIIDIIDKEHDRGYALFPLHPSDIIIMNDDNNSVKFINSDEITNMKNTCDTRIIKLYGIRKAEFLPTEVLIADQNNKFLNEDNFENIISYNTKAVDYYAIAKLYFIVMKKLIIQQQDIEKLQQISKIWNKIAPERRQYYVKYLRSCLENKNFDLKYDMKILKILMKESKLSVEDKRIIKYLNVGTKFNEISQTNDIVKLKSHYQILNDEQTSNVINTSRFKKNKSNISTEIKVNYIIQATMKNTSQNNLKLILNYIKLADKSAIDKLNLLKNLNNTKKYNKIKYLKLSNSLKNAIKKADKKFANNKTNYLYCF